VLEQRLKDADVTAEQVQVAWIKQALAGPARLGEFPAHARQLQEDLITILNMARERYPNLQLAYLSNRTYAGYATTALNPEPYAYESAFAVRWVIRAQIAGEPRLNADPALGEVKAPVVLWGPYLWTNGTTPREADGLVWTREDTAEDGTHPSNSGRRKVAALLLKFFRTDFSAIPWFAPPRPANED
jgi:lysophospholipase L1-like esterase